MARIKATVSDEAHDFIRQRAQEDEVSMSAIVAALIAEGAKSLYNVELAPPAPHGDVTRIERMAAYLRCPVCETWNVGIHEGQRVCADCGRIVGDGE